MARVHLQNFSWLQDNISPNFKCKKCGKSFVNHFSLKDHVVQAWSEGNLNYYSCGLSSFCKPNSSNM